MMKMTTNRENLLLNMDETCINNLHVIYKNICNSSTEKKSTMIYIY